MRSLVRPKIKTTHVIIRCSPKERGLWWVEANNKAKTLSQWIRDTLNASIEPLDVRRKKA